MSKYIQITLKEIFIYLMLILEEFYPLNLRIFQIWENRIVIGIKMLGGGN